MMQSMPEKPGGGLLDRIRQTLARRQRHAAEGEPGIGRFIGQIGVLGWLVVLPVLGGILLGRWLDHRFGTGVFWTAPLLLLGAVLGMRAAWIWMHRQ